MSTPFQSEQHSQDPPVERHHKDDDPRGRGGDVAVREAAHEVQQRKDDHQSNGEVTLLLGAGVGVVDDQVLDDHVPAKKDKQERSD